MSEAWLQGALGCGASCGDYPYRLSGRYVCGACTQGAFHGGSRTEYYRNYRTVRIGAYQDPWNRNRKGCTDSMCGGAFQTNGQGEGTGGAFLYGAGKHCRLLYGGFTARGAGVLYAHDAEYKKQAAGRKASFCGNRQCIADFCPGDFPRGAEISGSLYYPGA